MFCATVDRNGYLPTHNNKFSHAQGDDPVWNAAHMGGDSFALMKDVSAPIFVRGRHWGGVRLAYKPD